MQKAVDGKLKYLKLCILEKFQQMTLEIFF